ncbi:MAG TPA: hypothetical protein VFV47_06705 [Hyphomicrobiaceae bacterium]|nr:hypothetical protein [Hyphomicrobiaceae bacterium]
MSDLDNYLARAAQAREAAAAATLDNVRESCLRSEAAWMEMANRLIRLDAMQKRNLADKLAAKETLIGGTASQ